MPDLKDRLLQLKTDGNLLQKDIAKGAGIALRTYQYYETGEMVPSVNMLRKLSSYFQVSTDWLLGISDDKTIHSPVPPEGDA
jgi:transcriptional regulator with XRE-family HTH domain